jgi:hypothetical protein
MTPKKKQSSEPTIPFMGGEERALQMHERLLRDVVFQQAGTREKAVLEGVMNAVDAGSTRIEIAIDAERLRITDDGRGFQTREEIVANFETFGTPHEEGDAVYGRYRMGRGQLFAFGTNVWRTCTFEMRVDAKTKLAYHLTQGLPDRRGCDITVEWYDTLYPSALDTLVREVKKFVKYVNVPVLLNGERISTDPDTEKWDVVHKDYYVRLKETGSVHVYNLGVFVMEVPGYKYATGGTVVARRRLDVNFARNDVKRSPAPCGSASSPSSGARRARRRSRRCGATSPTTSGSSTSTSCATARSPATTRPSSSCSRT